jgi:hypothetical protein
MHMLKVKRNGEFLGIWSFEILGSHTLAHGARFSYVTTVE